MLTVNPGGTASPIRAISARLHPLPPRDAFRLKAPSATPSPKRNTRCRAALASGTPADALKTFVSSLNDRTMKRPRRSRATTARRNDDDGCARARRFVVVIASARCVSCARTPRMMTPRVEAVKRRSCSRAFDPGPNLDGSRARRGMSRAPSTVFQPPSRVPNSHHKGACARPFARND